MKKRLIAASDLLSVRWLSDPQITKDGSLICVTESRICADSGLEIQMILLVSSETGVEIPPPSGHPDRMWAGRWSPEGQSLAFLGSRNGDVQLWLWEVTRNEIEQLTEEPHGVAGPGAWSPDGQSLAYPFRGEANSGSQLGDDAYTITQEVYKTDGVRIGAPIAKTGMKVFSMLSKEANLLTTPLGQDSACSWSPDGNTVAFISDRANPEAYSSGPALWTVEVESRSLHQLTDGHGLVQAPVWSPDGRKIAFIGNSNRHDTSLNHEIKLIEIAPRIESSVTDGLDISFGLCVQSDDLRGYGDSSLDWKEGFGILSRYPECGTVHLGWVEPLEGNPEGGVLHEVLKGDRSILSFSASDSGAIAFVATDPTSPGELFLATSDGNNERQLTDRNGAWLSEVQLGEVSLVSVRATDAFLLDAWLLAPPVKPTNPAPLILSVHGGPHWPAGWRFSFENQRLSALGYYVAVSNLRGSQGYGEQFSSSINGAWGQDDFEDVKHVAEQLSASPAIDGSKLVLMGASYGGFMVCWAIAFTTMFRAAVAENAVIDLVSLAGTTSDGGYSMAEEIGGWPESHADTYHDMSPLTYAHLVQTPLLLIHGELDQNCPIGQSEQMYSALRRSGGEVSFVRIPGEGHAMVLNGSWLHRLQRWKALDAFLESHVLSMH